MKQKFLKAAARDNLPRTLRLLQMLEANRPESQWGIRVKNAHLLFSGGRRSVYDGLEELVEQGWLVRRGVRYRQNVIANEYRLSLAAVRLIRMEYGDDEQLPF